MNKTRDNMIAEAQNILARSSYLVTPCYIKYYDIDAIYLRNKNTINISKAQINSNGFDVYYNFGNYAIGINFTHKNRKISIPHNLESNVGILEIELNKDTFSGQKIRPILDEYENKKWVYHPIIQKFQSRFLGELTEHPSKSMDSALGGLIHDYVPVRKCSYCKTAWKGQINCPYCYKFLDK